MKILSIVIVLLTSKTILAANKLYCFNEIAQRAETMALEQANKGSEPGEAMVLATSGGNDYYASFGPAARFNFPVSTWKAHGRFWVNGYKTGGTEYAFDFTAYTKFGTCEIVHADLTSTPKMMLE